MFRQILSLKARLVPMWEYIGQRDQSVMVDGHFPKESMTRVAWMVLGSALGVSAIDSGPTLFSVFEPRGDDLLYLGVVSIPPSPRG